MGLDTMSIGGSDECPVRSGRFNGMGTIGRSGDTDCR